MLKEYMFYDQNPLEFPLHESIEVVNTTQNLTSKYLVSNVKTDNSYLYAPEINYYVKNSEDVISDKIHNVKKLYDARGVSLDFVDDIELSQSVGNKLVVICLDEHSDFIEEAKKRDFVTLVFNPNDILEVSGCIGNLHVSFLKDQEELEVVCDQIVWFEMPKIYTQKVGMYDLNVLGLEKIIETLCSNVGEYRYKHFITYDSQTCQYHERKRADICTECVGVCPSGAIIKIDSKKHLQFSHIDCIGCGACVSVCPSSSLDLAQMPFDAFSKMSSFYKNSIVLLIPSKVDFESLDLKLPKGVLPLVIESKDALNEAHFMTLLQTSTYPVLFFTKALRGAVLEVVSLVNEIFQRKYNKQAIFTCKDENELQEACKNIQAIDACSYGINQEGMSKREIFSARLAHLVGSENLGTITTGKIAHYGNLKIDDEKCTLCFSCIGACNVKALTAHPEDNSLRFNPSLCTSCGYCVLSCPEKGCISVVENELSLEPKYFIQNIMAQDELFACQECGKEFATVKSVQKIAAMMAPHFGNDPRKMATLYCCAECKPKVMFGDALEKGFAK